MLQANFKAIGPVILEKTLKVFTLDGHGGRLGHVTWTKDINFLSVFAWRKQMKFDWSWISSFRGEVLRKCWLTSDLLPRSPNDLDL